MDIGISILVLVDQRLVYWYWYIEGYQRTVLIKKKFLYFTILDA